MSAMPSNILTIQLGREEAKGEREGGREGGGGREGEK